MTDILATPREKLQGAIKFALKKQIAELENDLMLLRSAEEGMKTRLFAALEGYAWAEFGVRVGSVVRAEPRKTARIKPSEPKEAKVVKVHPESDSFGPVKPTLTVVHRLQNGEWGVAEHRLYGFLDNWEVIVP